MLNVNQLIGFGDGGAGVSSNPLAGGLWNWSDRNTLIDNISLGDTKVYTIQTSAWAAIRATKFVAPGEIAKFEIHVADGVGGYTNSHACGVSTAAASLYNSSNSLLGSSGHYLVGNSDNGYVGGNYLGFRVDRVTNKLYVYKNGVALTTVTLTAVYNLYPLAQLLGPGTVSAVINCTESSFVYPIP